jgi:hypothetical protein
MAAYVIENAHEAISLLEATLPVDVNTDAPPAPEVEGAV